MIIKNVVREYSKQLKEVTHIPAKEVEILIMHLLQKNVIWLHLNSHVEFTKEQWIERLEWAFNNDGIKFTSQSILKVQVSMIHMKEYSFRLEDKNNNTYSPGDFISIVYKLGWMAKLEQEVFGKIFDKVLADKVPQNVAVNISPDFIQDKNCVNWLIKQLQTRFSNSSTRIYFECVNTDILNNLELFITFKKAIEKTGHKIAIESFTFDNENLEYLKQIKPAYIKISKSYIIGIECNNSNSLLMNITSAIGAYLIVKHVETKEEFEELKQNGIEYVQGKYVDTIEVK